MAAMVPVGMEVCASRRFPSALSALRNVSQFTQLLSWGLTQLTGLQPLGQREWEHQRAP